MENQGQTYSIPLQGVESEHCALIVSKGISQVKGVVTSRIELNNRRALIQTSSPDAITETVTAIRDLGYDVATVRATYNVIGMTCASCAVSVESILKTQRGVIKASVNFATAQVSVEYIPGVINPEELKGAIQSIGYDILIDDDSGSIDTIEAIQQDNFRKIKLKTYWALMLSLPIMIISMFFMDMPYGNEIMWILSTPVVVWLGKDFFVNAWKQAKHRSANMDTLVALSTGVAYLFSVFNTLFPHFWHERGLHAHVYFEAASVVIAFILLGKLLEEKAKGNTSSAIKKLMGLQPKFLTIINESGQQQQLPIEKAVAGNIILVKPGEIVPVDGVITEGQSYVDESMLSGEPDSVQKNINDHVYAGTINQKGSFRMRAEKASGETVLAGIIRMVQEAQGSKAPVQKLVDKIAAVFVPVVIGLSILTFIIWLTFGGENAFTQGLLATVTILVIACPCALGLATPTAIMVGIGQAAARGILIKDAESLELIKNINAVVLDKTGTITEGKPRVSDALWIDRNPVAKNILLSLENISEHPLAEAVVQHLKDATALPLENFQSITGRGVSATLRGNTYYAGNKRLLRENNIRIDHAAAEMAEKWLADSHTVIWFADSREVLAVIAIADQIKENSASAVAELHRAGVEVYMLTGDNESAAKAVAGKTGIINFKAEVLPEQKATFIRELQQSGKRVAMVGDGINDSAALAQADVGIAMGKGSDIAIDVATITILSSDLSKINDAIKLSALTVRTIHQNLFWAFIYNIIGIPLAAGILYPFTGFLLNPMIAGAAMALSSVSVVSNSLLLKYRK
ncbi:MAG: heavy metal translocating P-type ATPase [Bacteroidia bacterium]|nr:heavy metal translocating P-type ATPase [Bacteroidia bacterium]